MGICIFVKGASNRGKTTAIKALAQLIGVDENSNLWVRKKKEIRDIHNWNGHLVALCSEGDPGSDSLNWVREIAIDINNCEIVVVACRRGGSTQDPILPYLQEKGYTIVEVYPSTIKVTDNRPVNFTPLAKALAHQILFIMTNYNSFSFTESTQY